MLVSSTLYVFRLVATGVAICITQILKTIVIIIHTPIVQVVS